jgi:hypothetical protein
MEDDLSFTTTLLFLTAVSTALMAWAILSF